MLNSLPRNRRAHAWSNTGELIAELRRRTLTYRVISLAWLREMRGGIHWTRLREPSLFSPGLANYLGS